MCNFSQHTASGCCVQFRGAWLALVPRWELLPVPQLYMMGSESTPHAIEHVCFCNRSEISKRLVSLWEQGDEIHTMPWPSKVRLN